ncbi:MAG: PilZ domain-containing protein [Thermoanaerobaculia bacterium]|nr:PilZ domain-containing protein [Thermoanaerobaculia bacterium]
MERVEDRRRFRRARIPGIRATHRTLDDVKVLDLSLAGMAVEAPGEFEQGDRCFFELRRGDHTVNVEAEVRWASAYRVERTEGGLDLVFRLGVSFVDIFKEDSGGIWDWLLVDPDATEH